MPAGGAPALTLPATLWRRLAALAYDGLLYLALVMAGLVLALPFVAFFVAEDARTPLQNYAVLQAYGFVVGLLFFGWSWTRGGQTLGMRVWRLQLRRLDGAVVRWPVATVRFAVGIAFLVLGLWAGQQLGPAGYGAMLLGFAPCLVSDRRRAVCDFAAGTEIVGLPRAVAAGGRTVRGGDDGAARG